MTSRDFLRQTLQAKVRPYLLDSAFRSLEFQLSGADASAITAGVDAWLRRPENSHFAKNPLVEDFMAALRQAG